MQTAFVRTHTQVVRKFGWIVSMIEGMYSDTEKHLSGLNFGPSLSSNKVIALMGRRPPEPTHSIKHVVFWNIKASVIRERIVTVRIGEPALAAVPRGLHDDRSGVGQLQVVLHDLTQPTLRKDAVRLYRPANSLYSQPITRGPVELSCAP